MLKVVKYDNTMQKRKRRKFTPEYKAETERWLRVAHDLDLIESTVRNCAKQAEIDAGRGPAGALTSEGREESETAASGE